MTNLNRESEISRRRFLSARSAEDSDTPQIDPHSAGSGDANSADERDAEGTQPTYMMQIGRRAMACEFAVLLNDRQYRQGSDAAVDALDLVDELEDQLTIYRDHSEVSRINRSAVGEATQVEPGLFALLRQCVELWRATDGAFDITSGPLIRAWGFLRRRGRVPSDVELRDALACVGSQHLTLDKQSIRFAQTGMDINLGAIGKGHALDRCSALMADRQVDDYLIHGGQSSVLARGQRQGGSDQSGWIVGVRHPLRPGERLLEVSLLDQALGTSGSAAQSFYHLGRRYGHILDPRSGQPASQLLSATVIARSAAVADALSTAFYVMGLDATRAYCERSDDVSAMLVTAASRSGAIELNVCGVSPDRWRRVDSGYSG